jgi:hypothetical protein
MTHGLFKYNISQEGLKSLVGDELELYRKAKGIIAPLEPKHRCWRLEYADELKFHMDIVPCIPEPASVRMVLTERMTHAGLDQALAAKVSELAVAITDDQNEHYPVISKEWQGSNLEGYVLWFVSQMKKARPDVRVLLERAQVDALPVYSRKTPLQRVIQILKRHRDVMFVEPKMRESKPISIIITTLVAGAYSGYQTLEQTLEEALVTLMRFVDSNSNEVRNPIDPSENFADKWTKLEYQHLQLKENFHRWVEQLAADLFQLANVVDRGVLQETVKNGFAISMKSEVIDTMLGSPRSAAIHTKPIREITAVGSKPWIDEPL